MRWLEKSSDAWEESVADGLGRRGKDSKDVSDDYRTFFGDMVDGGSGRKCYNCGEEGHIARDCSQSSSEGRKGAKSTGGGSRDSNSDGRGSKDREEPLHRQYHCAYHKDDSSTSCSTEDCKVLRYRLKYEERLKLMEANGDCAICCGDCPKGICSAKYKRTCGGKTGEGCGTSHIGHENFCRRAKFVFSVQVAKSLKAESEEDDVLLQVMKIPSLNGSDDPEAVLWDTACSGIFVRNEHAMKMKFPFEERRLRVRTLGGDEKEINGRIYDCQIKDLRGKIYEFKAHGLDNVTGDLGGVPSKKVMKKLLSMLEACCAPSR